MRLHVRATGWKEERGASAVRGTRTMQPGALGRGKGRTGNNLSSTSLSVLGSLDDSGQVEDLNRGAVDIHRTGHT